MSSKRLSGKDVDVMVGDYQMHVEEFTLTVEDGTQGVSSRGRPNGWVTGSVSAGGDITVDTANLMVLMDAAKAAGSFMDLDAFDIVSHGETTEDTLKIEAFGCKLTLSDVLNASASNEDKLTHKIGYAVTGKDFVRMNGVPYAPDRDIERLR